MRRFHSSIGALTLALAASQPAAALVADATATRSGDTQVTLRWTGKGPVDVLLADRPDADAAATRLVSRADRDGRATVTVDAVRRPYFFIREKDGWVTRVAERLIPLHQGSNFRDIGGYPGADGRHVRWGVIYRSGATAMLTPEDVATVNGLGLKTLVDLRSDEERVLAPTRIDGVPYTAVGYSMQRIFDGMKTPGSTMPQNGGALYRNLPLMLAPQMKLLFAALLRRDGPVEYNCSAGQDRTGFATAMILSALGTPRDVILEDYHLSTALRQPQYEMPPFDPAKYLDNPVAKMWGANKDQARKAQPLMGADGKAFLSDALEEIDTKWGSPEGYLQQVVGLAPVDIASLRAAYLE